MSEIEFQPPSVTVAHAPPPAWAEVPEFVRGARPTSDQTDGGRCAWLSDSQVRLSGPDQTWLSRTVYEVTSPDGLQVAGVFGQDFNPSFETLTLHHVRIIRDGVTREVDTRAGLEVFRRERDLERAVFDGRLTAHLSIPDVREGDIIDICHSVSGVHPTLKDHFSAEWRFNWTCWVGETQVRLIAPKGRRFSIQSWNGAPDPEVARAADGGSVWTWRALNTAPQAIEAGAPAWVRPLATVRVTEKITWAQVADRFRGAYAPQALPSDLEGAVREIERAHTSPADRAVAALRMVQSGLRYQAVTIGEGGFVPRSVERIWGGRSGDCKDASRILVSILHRLGLTGDAVLVNTFRGRNLRDEAPSLAVFDHCIVGLRLDGRRYWMDPTLFPQGGRLNALRQPRFGWALPLVAEAGLEDMGQDPRSDSLSVSETYELPPNVTGVARVRVETVHMGWRADAMRRRIAGGLAAVARDFRAYAERTLGPVISAEPLQVHDDLEANRLTVAESYEVGPIWKESADGKLAIFQTIDDMIGPVVPDLQPEGRRWPIDLGMPLRAKSRIDVKLPVVTQVAEWNDVTEYDGLQSTSKLMTMDSPSRWLRLERSLTFDRTVLEAQEAREFTKFRERSLNGAGLVIRHPIKNGRLVAPKPTKSTTSPWRIVYWIFLGIWILSMFARLLNAS